MPFNRWVSRSLVTRSAAYVTSGQCCRHLFIHLPALAYSPIYLFRTQFGAAHAKRYTTSAAAKWRKPRSKSWRVVNMHADACHKKCCNFVMPRYFFQAVFNAGFFVKSSIRIREKTKIENFDVVYLFPWAAPFTHRELAYQKRLDFECIVFW